MFKIGDLVTKDQFIKYAPYGMELKHEAAGIVLRYDMKDYENFWYSADTEDWPDAVPGFVFCENNSAEPMDGVWNSIEKNIEDYDNYRKHYRISRLPILKLLKRKQI